MAKPGLESAFADFKEREALAESMIPMIGTLYRRNVVIYIHGVPLYNQSVIELMKAPTPALTKLVPNALTELLPPRKLFHTFPKQF